MAAAWAYEVGGLGGAVAIGVVEIGVEWSVSPDSDAGDWDFWEAGTG